jgi:hypothetical protein
MRCPALRDGGRMRKVPLCCPNGVASLTLTHRKASTIAGRPFREPAKEAKFFPAFHPLTERKRSAFAITDTELRLIAAAATIGLKRTPNAG